MKFVIDTQLLVASVCVDVVRLEVPPPPPPPPVPPDAQVEPAPNTTTDVSPAANTQLGILTVVSSAPDFASVCAPGPHCNQWTLVVAPLQGVVKGPWREIFWPRNVPLTWGMIGASENLRVILVVGAWCDFGSVWSVVVPSGVVSGDGGVVVVFVAVVFGAEWGPVEWCGGAAGSGPGLEVIDLDVWVAAAGPAAFVVGEEYGFACAVGEES